jgi:hypothetical protein
MTTPRQKLLIFLRGKIRYQYQKTAKKLFIELKTSKNQELRVIYWHLLC